MRVVRMLPQFPIREEEEAEEVKEEDGESRKRMQEVIGEEKKREDAAWVVEVLKEQTVAESEESREKEDRPRTEYVEKS